MKLSAVILLPLIAALVACGDDAAPVEEPAAAGVSLRLTLAGEAAATRSAANPRQLVSTDNWQHATNVRLYAFRAAVENGYYRYQHVTGNDGVARPYIYIPEFNNKTTIWTDETRDEQYEAFVQQYLTTGYYYKFLAVGRDDITEDDATGSTINLDLTPGVTTLEEATATLAAGRNTSTEIFCGYNADAIPAQEPHLPICRTIELRRAVAGLLLYVENIPYELKPDAGGSKVQIHSVGITPAAGYNNKVSLKSREYAGTATTSAAPFVTVSVPNGWTHDTSKNTWTNPQGTGYHPNAVSAKGAFITPQPTLPDFTTETGRTPLRLTFYDASGNAVCSRPIKIATDITVNADGTHSAPVAASHNNYALLANHIYCLGQRHGGTGTPYDLTPDSDPSLPGTEYIMVWGMWQAEVNIDI